MSFIQSTKKCDKCGDEINVVFGIVGMTMVGDGGPTRCRCGGNYRHLSSGWNANKKHMDQEITFKAGDRVDRAGGNYRFPGTILTVYSNPKGIEYAVVEMDEFELQHIFRTSMLRHV